MSNQTLMTWPGCGAGFVRDDSASPAPDLAEAIKALKPENEPRMEMPCYWYRVGFRDARAAAATLAVLAPRAPEQEAAPRSDFAEALKCALAQTTLPAALSFICTWENERAVDQAVNRPWTGSNGGRWDTLFDYCIREVMRAWGEQEAARQAEPG